MRLRIVRLLASAMATYGLASIANAQAAPRWRLGVDATAPTTVLSSGALKIKLGVGLAFEAGRLFAVKERSNAVLLVRLHSASVNGSGAGSSWTAGRALIADLSVRAGHTVRTRGDVFAGVGISHWSGPESTAPFSGASSVLFAGEAGASCAVGNGAWRITGTAHVTRFGPDEAHGVVSGTVFRYLLGVRRDF